MRKLLSAFSIPVDPRLAQKSSKPQSFATPSVLEYLHAARSNAKVTANIKNRQPQGTNRAP